MKINVLEFLEETSRRFPDKIAFTDQNARLSYLEVLSRSKAIGTYLANFLNNQKGKPIGVLIDRDIISIVSFLGVIYSGNFYVPLDLKLPVNRLNAIIETIDPKVIISSAQRDLPSPEGLNFRGKILNFEEMIAEKIDGSLLAKIRRDQIDTDPLYAMFTSGSTGKPKGVLINHRSVINFIENFSNIFDLNARSVIGNQAPFDFDVSVKDIYSTLRNGATLYVIPKNLFSFPINLINFLNEKKINTIIWATSALRIIANFRSFEKLKPKYLKKILFSGEVMPNKILNYWRKNIPNAVYVNLYGPTEITCNCTYFIVDRPFADNDWLPIGVPFPNADILLLNRNKKVIEPGEIGEICVRGSSLGLGYYNNLKETSKSFTLNPLNEAYPEKIYRTGDLGSYNEQMELLFHSRKDNQIKHMGHRIELGEIELAVNAIDLVEAAFCAYDKSKEEIVLFYQASEDYSVEIISHLHNDLPKYMIPTKIYQNNNFPLNKNGKIDRIKIINSTIKQDDQI